MGINAQMVNDGASISILTETVVSGVPDFTNSGTVQNNGQVNLVGNFDNQSVYTGNGTLVLDGSSQSIDLGDTVSTLTLSGNGVHTLSNTLYVSEQMNFESSKLSSGGNLEFLSGVITAGSGTSSYIIGALSCQGTDAMTFPIGTEDNYMPISLSSITGTDLTMEIEVFGSNLSGEPGRNLLQLAADKYWDVSTAAGTISEYVVSIPVVNETLTSDISELRIAFSSDESNYIGLDVTSVAGDLSSGEISSEVNAIGRFTLGSHFNTVYRESDSLALVSLYDQTNGEAWIINTGWKSEALDDWYGITVSNKRPVALDLSGNNLSGEISSLEDLDSLSLINLSANKLSAVIDFTSLGSVEELDISNNEIQFGDIESNLSIDTFMYSPQGDVLDSVSIFEEIGNTYAANREVSGSSNSYSWYKYADESTSKLTSVVSTQDIPVTSFNDEGYYYAEVTSNVITGLTLRTRPIFLKVSSIQRDSLALMEIYQSMNGAGWDVGDDWTQLPITQWEGIEMADSRVTGLNLPDNNLVGVLPDDLLDIRHLKSIDLSDNRISGITDLHELDFLTSVDLSGNYLDFGDLEPIVDIAALTYSPQRMIGSPLVDTLAIGSSLEFAYSVGGSANNYEWYFEGINDTLVLADAKESSYSIDSLSYESMGTYSMKVSSDMVSGLTIESFPKTVYASSKVTFKALNQSNETVNDGQAYLFKVIPDHPYDTLPVVNGSAANGYVFEDVVLGNYIALVEADLELYLPTYFSNTDLWFEATEIEVRQDVDETISIVSQPVEGTLGDGQLSGIVESEFEEEAAGRIDARRKVKRAGCSVRRFVPKGRNTQEEGDFQLVAYVQSDDDGRFEFDDLVAGLYRFNVDYPGIPMNEDSYVEFEIGTNGEENSTLVLEVLITEEAITVIEVDRLGFFQRYFNDLKVYPNPADEFLTIQYESLKSENVEVRLLDLSGHEILSILAEQGNNQQLRMDVADIPSGIYLIHFSDNRGSEKSILTYKVLIHHN